MTNELPLPRIAISLGDLNGIGPEVILKSLEEHAMTELMTPIVFGSSRVLSFHRKTIARDLKMNFHVIQDAADALPGKVNLVNVWKDEVQLELGAKSPEAGAYALKSLDAAARAVQEGKADALVTAPVNKDNIKPENGETFTGHTEWLGRLWGGEPLMILMSDGLKVALVTGHIPVSEVSKALNRDLVLKRINQLNKALLEDFRIRKPRIAVLGLNPHAGDGGLLGDEEAKVIGPAIDEAYRSGKLVYGPFAADGFFGSAGFKNYDAVLAMYHDQGLAPFKALSFGVGVNYTAGLACVRTSPDHGTGFAIAGKDEAHADSFRQALFAAVDVWRARSEWLEISKNPLPAGKHQGRD